MCVWLNGGKIMKPLSIVTLLAVIIVGTRFSEGNVDFCYFFFREVVSLKYDV